MDNHEFTPEDDFKDIQDFLDGKTEQPKLEKTNEELYACSWEELILHVRKCYEVIEEQRETIQGWQNDFQ